MSETPAPYWISRGAPYYSIARGGWVAVAVWVDTVRRRRLRAESEEVFHTEEAARAASHLLASDELERLFARKF